MARSCAKWRRILKLIVVAMSWCLEEAAAAPHFWDDRALAQENIAATRAVKQVLDPFDSIVAAFEDTKF